MPHVFRADLPPDDIKDLKAMIVEQYLGADTPTPEELVERIPKVSPFSSGAFTEEVTGHFKAVDFDWEQVPRVGWDVIYQCIK